MTPPGTGNISDGIQQCLCGHGVSRVKGKLHCDTTEPQNPGGLGGGRGAQGGWGCFLEVRAPNNHAGGLLPTSTAAASHAGDTWPGEGQSLPFVSS